MIMAYGNLLETGILFCEILIEKGWLIYEVHILYGEVMRIVLLASIILQAIAIGMSFAENIGEEKQRIIRYTGWFLLLIYMIFG